jgi:hypothetical protein
VGIAVAIALMLAADDRFSISLQEVRELPVTVEGLLVTRF